MKTRHVIGLSMLAGVALGVFAIQGLHAQAKPPVYSIVDIDEITDPVGFATNTARSNKAATANFKNTGGRYLVRTDKITGLDGVPPKRVIVAAFESARRHKRGTIHPTRKK